MKKIQKKKYKKGNPVEQTNMLQHNQNKIVNGKKIRVDNERTYMSTPKNINVTSSRKLPKGNKEISQMN